MERKGNMGVFSVLLEVGNPMVGEFVVVDAMVDTGSSYTVLREDLLADLGIRPSERGIVFAKPPTALSSSHRAIARAHGRTLVVTEAGDWEFRKG